MLTGGSLCERAPCLADRKLIEKMAEMIFEGEKNEIKKTLACASPQLWLSGRG